MTIIRLQSKKFPIKKINSGLWWETTVNFLKRDIKSRYASSKLGLLWVVLKPLILSGITSLVFAVVFSDLIEGVPYVLFVMVGFSVWNFFSGSISLATRSLVMNRNLVENVSFPKESVVVSVVLSRLIDFLVSFLLVLAIGWLYAWKAGVGELVAILAVLIGQIFLQMGLGLATATANVYFRDTESVVEVLMRALFYLTPVVYPMGIVPELIRKWLWLNPAGYLVMTYRTILFNRSYNWGSIGLFMIVSILTFGGGWLMFEKMKDKFAELI